MRTQARISGRVTVTELELRRGRGGGTKSTATGRGKMIYDFVAADYVADGSLFKITITHSLGNRTYTFDVFKTEDNTAINVDHFKRDDDTLVLWFYDDVKSIRVIIDP